MSGLEIVFPLEAHFNPLFGIVIISPPAFHRQVTRLLLALPNRTNGIVLPCDGRDHRVISVVWNGTNVINRFT